MKSKILIIEDVPEMAQLVTMYMENAGFLSRQQSEYLHLLLNSDDPVPVTRGVRNALLKGLVAYFQMHNEQIRKIESLDILATVLH